MRKPRSKIYKNGFDLIGQPLLHHKIELLKKENIIDENKVSRHQTVVFKTVWCAVMKFRIDEEFDDIKYIASKHLIFKIRYTEDIQTKHNIRFNQIIYSIESIEDINFTKEYLKIIAKEV